MIPDYHYKYPRGLSTKERDKLNIGDIWINGAVCLLCKQFIRSKNRHHYVSCRCGAVAVDGGSLYQRVIGNPRDYISFIELFDQDDNKPSNTIQVGSENPDADDAKQRRPGKRRGQIRKKADLKKSRGIRRLLAKITQRSSAGRKNLLNSGRKGR